MSRGHVAVTRSRGDHEDTGKGARASIRSFVPYRCSHWKRNVTTWRRGGLDSLESNRIESNHGGDVRGRRACSAKVMMTKRMNAREEAYLSRRGAGVRPSYKPQPFRPEGAGARRGAGGTSASCCGCAGGERPGSCASSSAPPAAPPTAAPPTPRTREGARS
mgnify:FL=1